MYSFKAEQKINCDINKVWDFISSPKNLSLITPSYMDFVILNPELLEKMYPGMMIHYRVRPMMNIPVKWVTEITHVEEPYYFVDEQRIGPYRMWHHEHRLVETKDGVLMLDTVHYVPPFGWIGDLAQALFIGDKLQSIFDYRRKKIDEIFNTSQQA